MGNNTLLDIGNSPLDERWNATLTPNVTYNPVTKGLVFGGSGDFVYFGPTFIGGAPFTVLIVARPDVIEPLVRLWAFYSAANYTRDEVALTVGLRGDLTFANNAAAASKTVSDPSWAVGVWSHIVVSVTAGGQGTVSLNGAAIASGFCA